MNDSEIIQFVLRDFNNKRTLEKAEEPEKKFPYDTAYLALQICLSFLEKQLDVTSLELMMICKWRDFAAEKKSVGLNKRF